MHLLFAFAVMCVVVAATRADDRLNTGVTTASILPTHWPIQVLIDRYGSVRPSMTCGTGCRPPMHEYHIEGLHDQRGCSDKAVFHHERMDKIRKIREGRRLTGRVENGWNGIVCEEEDSDECAPSYRYLAAFSIGCERKEANGTVTETYKTYTYTDLAKMMDIVLGQK